MTIIIPQWALIVLASSLVIRICVIPLVAEIFTRKEVKRILRAQNPATTGTKEEER